MAPKYNPKVATRRHSYKDNNSFLPFVLDVTKALRELYFIREGKEATQTIGPVKMNRFTVDLSIVGGEEFNKLYKESDRETHIRQQLNQKGTCSLEDILTRWSTYTIISGVAGIGKSHFASEIAYKWARGEVLREVSYLFLIKVRECNGLSSSSLPEFLSALFPNVFSHLTYEYLSSVSHKCCFVFDGFDEFSGLENITKIYELSHKRVKSRDEQQQLDEIPAVDHAVFDIIFPTNDVFARSKMILTGRPEGCIKLTQLYYGTYLTHGVILGFRESVVQKYIDTFYGNNDDKAKINVKNKLKQSEGLKLMSRIPLYLNIICSLYYEHSDIILGDSPLELYTWEMAFLLQKHILKDKSTSNLPTIEIFSKSLSETIIEPLSKMVYQMQVKKQFVFNESEIPETLRTFNFDSSGLIMKIKTSMGNKYQFFHLTMSEFLTATYLLYDKSIDLLDKIGQDDWNIILEFLCGLEGGLVENSVSPQVIKNFVKSLNVSPDPQHFVISDMLETCFAHDNRDERNLFMKCYSAFQNLMSSSGCNTNITRTIGNKYWLPKDYNNILNVIENEKKISIDKLLINDIPVNVSEDTLIKFLRCIGRCNKLEIDLTQEEDMLRYMEFHNSLNISDTNTNITRFVVNDEWQPKDYDNFIHLIKNEKDISIDKLIIKHIPTSENTLQTFVDCIGCCRKLNIELNVNDIQRFFHEFNKCYTNEDRDDNSSHSSYTTPIIDYVCLLDYTSKGNLNSLCRHDIGNILIVLPGNFYSLDSSTSIVLTINKHLIENNTSIKSLYINRRSPLYYIEGKSDQIDYCKLYIPYSTETIETVRLIKLMQKEGFEIIEVNWESIVFDVNEFIEKYNIVEEEENKAGFIQENTSVTGTPPATPPQLTGCENVIIDNAAPDDVIEQRWCSSCRCCTRCRCPQRCILL